MRRAGKLDLGIGIALGLVLGLLVTYLLVVVLVNSGKDTSTISTSPRSGRQAPGVPEKGGRP
jgi:hypothetical protein